MGGGGSCITVSIYFFIFISLSFRLSVTELVSYIFFSVYLFIGTLITTEIPATTGIYLRHEPNMAAGD